VQKKKIDDPLLLLQIRKAIHNKYANRIYSDFSESTLTLRKAFVQRKFHGFYTY